MTARRRKPCRILVFSSSFHETAFQIALEGDAHGIAYKLRFGRGVSLCARALRLFILLFLARAYDAQIYCPDSDCLITTTLARLKATNNGLFSLTLIPDGYRNNRPLRPSLRGTARICHIKPIDVISRMRLDTRKEVNQTIGSGPFTLVATKNIPGLRFGKLKETLEEVFMLAVRNQEDSTDGDTIKVLSLRHQSLKRKRFENGLQKVVNSRKELRCQNMNIQILTTTHDGLDFERLGCIYTAPSTLIWEITGSICNAEIFVLDYSCYESIESECHSKEIRHSVLLSKQYLEEKGYTQKEVISLLPGIYALRYAKKPADVNF